MGRNPYGTVQVVLPVLGVVAGVGLVVYAFTRSGGGGGPGGGQCPPGQVWDPATMKCITCPPGTVWDGTKCAPINLPPPYVLPDLSSLGFNPPNFIGMDAAQTLGSFTYSTGGVETLIYVVRFNRWAAITTVDVAVTHRQFSTGSINVYFWDTNGGLHEIGKMWQLNPFATGTSGQFTTQGQLTGGVVLASYLTPIGYMGSLRGDATLVI